VWQNAQLLSILHNFLMPKKGDVWRSSEFIPGYEPPARSEETEEDWKAGQEAWKELAGAIGTVVKKSG